PVAVDDTAAGRIGGFPTALPVVGAGVAIPWKDQNRSDGHERVLRGADPDADHFASPGQAGERERHLEEELEHAVDGAPLRDARETGPAAVAEPEVQAPKVVARLGAVPAPLDAASR